MKYMWQFIVFNLLKKIPICLFLATFMFQIGCGCLPKTSKEIDKVRSRDDRTTRIRKLTDQLGRYTKFKAFKDKLPKVQEKIKSLAGEELLINPGNEAKLIKVCKKFSLKKYIPYLQVEQEFLKLMDQEETDAFRKQEYKNNLARFTTKLTDIENLLKIIDAKKLCKFIISLRH